jgi:uncharacterized membrane protein YdbT with pleckstrin-like domain
MITLDNEEHIIKIVRKHWYSIAVGSVPLVVAGFLPVVIFIVLLFFREYLPVEEMQQHISVSMVLYVSSLWWLILWMSFFYNLTDYYLDAWIITNKRIVHVEQKGLFSRRISTVSLDRIQDVTSSVHGIIATWLRFGNVRVQSAGEMQKFLIDSVPDPNEIKQRIIEERNKLVQTNNFNPSL